MTFRTKLLIVFTLTVLGVTGLLAWGATQYVRQELDASDRQRSQALAAQVQREFALRGEEVSNRVQDIADAEGTVRMALDLGRPQADSSAYAGDARGLAATHRLDFLELVANDVLISSAQNPAQIGNKEDWVVGEPNWNRSGAFLRPVELPDGAQLALLAVREVRAGASDLYIIGGRRVDEDFLRTFVAPPGMRVLPYSNVQEAPDASAHPEAQPGTIISAEGPVSHPESFAPLLSSASAQPSSSDGIIQWSDDPASAERFLTIPLTGHKNEAAWFSAGGQRAKRIRDSGGSHPLTGPDAGCRRLSRGHFARLVGFRPCDASSGAHGKRGAPHRRRSVREPQCARQSGRTCPRTLARRSRARSARFQRHGPANFPSRPASCRRWSA